MKTINKKCIFNCVGICLLACVLLLSACASIRSNQEWSGTYSGTIPSASGSGIQVRMILNPNNTFELHYTYIDRSDNDFVVRGSFTWNSAGNTITLNTDRVPPHYQVGQNYLRQLDLQGRPITGNLSENYVLRKM
jgi:uncharacterized lipoprotein NlpE involved in copper resistance